MRAAADIRSRKAAWKALRRSLAACLEALDTDECLIIGHRGTNRFVQFASDGHGDMRMEATANVYIEPTPHVLTEDDFARMDALGWLRPSMRPPETYPDGPPKGSPNFNIDVVGATNWKPFARRAVRTLRDVFRIPHPRALEYTAFSTDGPAIRFPTLGIVSRGSSCPAFADWGAEFFSDSSSSDFPGAPNDPDDDWKS